MPFNTSSHSLNFPAKKNRRYWMTLTIPKDQPPLTLINRQKGEVVIEFVGEKKKRLMRFFVGFVSR